MLELWHESASDVVGHFIGLLLCASLIIICGQNAFEIIRIYTVDRILAYIHIVFIFDFKVWIIFQLINIHQVILLQLLPSFLNELSSSSFDLIFHLTLDLRLHFHSFLPN